MSNVSSLNPANKRGSWFNSLTPSSPNSSPANYPLMESKWRGENNKMNELILCNALPPKLLSGEIRVSRMIAQGMFIYKYCILLNMSRSIQTSSSIGKKIHNIRSSIRPKRIADVVGLRILADEDWKENRAELEKISKDTLNRLEKSY